MDTGSIALEKTKKEDLELFFNFQLDEESNHLAPFTPKDPADKPAYLESTLNI